MGIWRTRQTEVHRKKERDLSWDHKKSQCQLCDLLVVTILPPPRRIRFLPLGNGWWVGLLAWSSLWLVWLTGSNTQRPQNKFVDKVIWFWTLQWLVSIKQFRRGLLGLGRGMHSTECHFFLHILQTKCLSVIYLNLTNTLSSKHNYWLSIEREPFFVWYSYWVSFLT